MNTIKWGIIGLGSTSSRMIKGLEQLDSGRLVAVASRTERKLSVFKEAHPQVTAYQDYDALLAHPALQAVYITLRHEDHYKWAYKALSCGIAVLCEKPATLSVQETQSLIQAAQTNHTFFLEALKTRFMPLTQILHSIIDQGLIGHIEVIETAFCYDMPYKEGSYLYELDQGGILNDVGTYTLGAILDYIHSPISDIKVTSDFKNNVDVYEKIELKFENGTKAIAQNAMDRNLPRFMRIQGSLGKIEMDNFHRPTQFTLTLNQQAPQIFTHDQDDFVGQVEAVHQGILDKTIEDTRFTHQDSVRIIEVMEKVRLQFKHNA